MRARGLVTYFVHELVNMASSSKECPSLSKSEIPSSSSTSGSDEGMLNCGVHKKT